MTVPPPPEPPEDNPGVADDPFGISPNADASNTDGNVEFDEPGLDSGRPEVAASKSRIIAVMGSVGLVLALLVYNIFSTEEKVVTEKKKIDIVQAPPEPSLSPPPSLPGVGPVAPVAIVPPPAIVPPAVPAPTIDTLPVVDPAKESAAAAQLAERQRSGIFASGGGTGGLLGGPETTPTQQGFFGSGADVGFANSAQMTQAIKATATRIPNLNRTVAQGRIIQATLETAISTDLPAQIRAIVSRDTYGEAGDVPLIPRGSRLIGVYNNAILTGQSRVFIIWQRLIRPDGIDIMINSPGVDGLGMAGLQGQLDTKFQQVFSRAVLSSVIAISLAIGADSLGVGESSQSTSIFGNGQSSTTTQGDAAATATNSAIANLGSVTSDFLTRFMNVQPTIIVDQGTPVNVMLNRDLIFPADVAGGMVIP